jgi:pyruvate dehydrogenase complex dehydrogenase (E1) component
MTEKMENVGYSSIDEIINDILHVLSPEYQETIKEMSNNDFRDIEHFNFGQWIRNKYFYKNPKQEQLVKSLSDPKEHMLLDGDEFSHMILDQLYEKVTTEKK